MGIASETNVSRGYAMIYICHAKPFVFDSGLQGCIMLLRIFLNQDPRPRFNGTGCRYLKVVSVKMKHEPHYDGFENIFVAGYDTRPELNTVTWHDIFNYKFDFQIHDQ